MAKQEQIQAVVGSLWRHPNFRRLWISDTISQFGGQFSGWAIPTIAAYVLGASPLELGILGAMAVIAWPIFALPVGVWIDQNRRRPIMVTANIGRAIALAMVPLTWFLGTNTFFKIPVLDFNLFNIYTLYIVSFVVGLLTIFFDISYQSLLPSIVDNAQLVEGNSKLQISQSAAQVFGPTISTTAIQLITVPASPLACIGDAVGFSASAFFLRKIDKEEPVPKDHTGMPSFLNQIREGLMVVVRDSTLRSIAASGATFNLFNNAIGVLILVFARDVLKLVPSTAVGAFGIAASIGSIGGLIGALYAARLAKRLGVGPTIVISQFAGTLGFLFLALDTPALAVPIIGLFSPFLIIFFFLVSLGGVIYNVNQVSLRQSLVPLKLQGRMNASIRWIIWGTIPIGSFSGGVLAQTLGVREAITICALGALLAGVWLLLGPVRHLRTIPNAEEV